MIKDLVSSLDYSNLANTALVLFAVTFGMILYGTFRLSRTASDKFASIPLSDDVRDPRDGQ